MTEKIRRLVSHAGGLARDLQGRPRGGPAHAQGGRDREGLPRRHDRDRDGPGHRQVAWTTSPTPSRASPWRSRASAARAGAPWRPLVVASNLPDIDCRRSAWAGRRPISSITATSATRSWARPLLALALALALRLTVRGSRFLGLLAVGLVGVAGHVFMDLWTSYGTRVFSPFDRTFYTWDLVFIIDPVILLILLTTVLLARRPTFGSRAATVGLGLVLAYVGGRAVLHARAVDELVARVPDAHVLRATALPNPIDPRVLARPRRHRPLVLDRRGPPGRRLAPAPTARQASREPDRVPGSRQQRDRRDLPRLLDLPVARGQRDPRGDRRRLARPPVRGGRPQFLHGPRSRWTRRADPEPGFPLLEGARLRRRPPR